MRTKNTYNSGHYDRFIHTVAVPLTVHEERDYGRELAKLGVEKQALEQRKKDVVTEIKALEDKNLARQRELQELVTSGKERRPMDCFNEFDYANAKCLIRRTDTGEQVDSRILEIDEARKRPLDFMQRKQPTALSLVEDPLEDEEADVSHLQEVEEVEEDAGVGDAAEDTEAEQPVEIESEESVEEVAGETEVLEGDEATTENDNETQIDQAA